MSWGDWRDWLKEMSWWKIILILLGIMMITDLFFYYFTAIIGKPVSPYPILYEIFKLLKEVKIVPDMGAL